MGPTYDDIMDAVMLRTNHLAPVTLPRAPRNSVAQRLAPSRAPRAGAGLIGLRMLCSTMTLSGTHVRKDAAAHGISLPAELPCPLNRGVCMGTVGFSCARATRYAVVSTRDTRSATQQLISASAHSSTCRIRRISTAASCCHPSRQLSLRMLTGPAPPARRARRQFHAPKCIR
jgi:hypothetical protein